MLIRTLTYISSVLVLILSRRHSTDAVEQTRPAFKRMALLDMLCVGLLTGLAACGGGGNNKKAEQEEPEKQPVIAKSGRLVIKTPLNKPVAGIAYRTSHSVRSSKTAADGSFNYDSRDHEITFTVTGQSFRVTPDKLIDVDQFYSEDAHRANLRRVLNHLDKDNAPDNGVDLNTELANSAKIDPSATENEVSAALYRLTGRHPDLLFKPSLGINTEAPQAEADTAGQAMPFVDIFRTARPFAELSGAVTLDEQGWPTKVDPALGYAKTKLLQGTLAGAFPEGTYTLLYEGAGTIQLGGAILNVRGLSDQQGLTFDLKLDPVDSSKNEINLNLLDIAPGEGNYISNIRIIMPGGHCVNQQGIANPYVHAQSAQACPKNSTYQSFADSAMQQDRNSLDAVIFNPDYLAFLRHFKTVRMMNLMEASHGVSSCAVSDGEISEIDMACVLKPTVWEERARLNDAVWGGSGRTPHQERNGIPVELMVKLANTLKRDVWLNMPYSADDDYIERYADYVAKHLDPNLKVYLEYANETWNPGFLGHFFVEARGIEAGLDSVPEEFESYRDAEYFARLRFYTQRALELFSIWQTAFDGAPDRLVRVLGTNQGDKVLTEQMLKQDSAAGKVDAVAMAPYFFGCIQSIGPCTDAERVLADAKTTDDIFSIVDQDRSVDPSALSGTLAKIESQAEIASSYNLKLLAYEGGQHLTTSLLGALDLDETEKERFRALFRAANRDPRMKERYRRLLDGWRQQAESGAALFTLYTQPQSYYQFGSWGLKEHLNQPRTESPKYDAVMNFQEQNRRCWWDRCETD